MKKCLKTRILPFVCLLALLITALVVPIGAEVTPPTPPTYTPTYDYPGANLIPYPYRDFSDSNVVVRDGVTFTLEDYGIIVTGGDSTSHVEFLLANIYVDAGTYTVSGSDQPVILYCVAFIDGSYYDDWSNATFTLPEPALLQLRLEIPSGRAVSTTIYPMLNKGSTAYEYQPYLPYYFQQAFNDGWNQSYIDGFSSGLEVASKGVNNLFYGAALSVAFNDDDVFYRYQFSYDEIPYNKGVLRLGDLPGVSSEALNMPNVDVVFIWPTGGEWYYPNGSVKTNAGDNTADVFVGAVVSNPPRGSIGNAVDAYLSSDPSGFRSVEFDYPYYRIKQLSFQIMEGYPLQDVAFVSQSYQYNVGYDNGYTSGFNDGQSTSYQTGYDAGNSAGYKKGYSLGKEEGLKIGQDGNFTSLMTAVVDAPVKALTGLLDFEILGQNMLSFLGALLSLSLILIFIKKVVL